MPAVGEAASEFKGMGCEVFGVSIDSQFSHKAWVEKDLGGLNYPLLSDMGQAMCRSYGVLSQENVALRGVFFVDPKGIVQFSCTYCDNVGRNTEELIRTLAALQAGGLCPVNWKRGGSTL
ncbi:redoxin domain-containing protein [bacterium]|nr:redoxin domain-containing protein [bacterium]